MADSVEYVVRIVGLGGGDDEDKTKKTKSALTTGLEGLQKAMHPIQSALSHKKGEDLSTYYGKEVAKNTIRTVETIVTTSVNRYFRLSEDYRGQNYMNNVMGNINRAKGFGDSVVAGAIAGSKFGPFGAVIGTAVNGASTLIRDVINYQNQIADYKTSLNATRIETSFRAERAGLYDGGKGTEN